MATQITDAKTLNEISRFANIMTELDFTTELQDTFGSGLSSVRLQELDACLDTFTSDLSYRDYDFYYDFYANKVAHRYCSYEESENIIKWLSTNINTMIAYFAYDEIFGKYGSLSIYLHIEYDRLNFWRTKYKSRKRFGSIVKKTRLAKGYKQDSLGLDQGLVSKLENGEANITLDNLLTISRMLDMELKFV